MNILFAIPYAPTLIRVRPYNLIRQLTARGHQVTVMTVWTNQQEREALEELHASCSQVASVQLPGWRSLWNCVWALPSGKPLQTVYSWEKNLAQASFERLVQPGSAGKIDVVHVEHLRGARYGLYLKSRMKAEGIDIPIVWDSVDSISHLFRQAMRRSKSAINRGITRFELKRTEPYEAWLATQFDRTLVTSRLDREAMLSLVSQYGNAVNTGDGSQAAGGAVDEHSENAGFGNAANDSDRITVLRNGVDLEYFQPGDPEKREPATVLASGKMSYHANVTMVVRLVESIMPAVWARDPGVKVVIVGKDPPKRIRDLQQDARVAVTGTLADIRPHLQTATIAAAPIDYGAGIQNKVLEAMACATPVIATPQAVSAIDLEPGVDALVAEDDQSFAEAILALIGDRERQIILGGNGRRYVERNHRWSAIAEQLEAIYRQEIESRYLIRK